jgi:hypothetical protein
VFAKQGVRITKTVEARKEQVADEKAWEYLKQADEIVVGRGKKFQVFKPDEVNKTDILGNCLGRTGNLRAPTLKVGNRFIVGFNEDMYREYFGK